MELRGQGPRHLDEALHARAHFVGLDVGPERLDELAVDRLLGLAGYLGPRGVGRGDDLPRDGLIEREGARAGLRLRLEELRLELAQEPLLA